MNLARPAALGLLLGFVTGLSPACGPTKPCGPDTCAGCCDASGACLPGSQASACGSAGSKCVACEGDRACTAGFCSGSNAGGAGGGGASDDGGTGGGAGGGAGGGTGGGGANPGTVDGFVTQLANDYCARSIACGFTATAATADCQALLRLYFGEVRRSGALGATGLDQASATACLASLGTASCDALGRQLTLCFDAFRATAVTGAACATGSDCASAGDRCSGREWCSRACRTLGTLGGPCRGAVCDRGLYCDTASKTCAPTVSAGSACPIAAMCDGNSACVQGMCVALPVAGQACRSVTPRCAESAFCVGLVCQARRPSGSACATVDECEVGLACVKSTCTARIPEGGACTATAECVDGLTCDSVLQRCLAVDANVHRGAECTRHTRVCGVDPQVCAGQSRAIDGGTVSSGTCRDTAAGDACASHTDCNAGHFCQPGSAGNASGQCRPATALSACASAANCRPQDDCVGRVCQPRIATGSPCFTGGPGCLDPAAVCVTDANGGGTCQRLLPPGATCSASGTCQFPALCEFGQCVIAGHVGEACLPTLGCLDGACLAPDGGPGTAPNGRCAQARPDGDACRSAPACSSGTCDLASGVCVAACR